MRRQKGMSTVEFAVAGFMATVILMGCIEIGRLFYVWNTLAEGTRHAAHIGVLCPYNDAAVKKAAMVVANTAGDSSVLYGLTQSMVSVAYLDSTGAPTTVTGSIAFVSVSISGYTHRLLIPGFAKTLTVPPFTTTVPSETLGYIPDTGAYTCMES